MKQLTKQRDIVLAIALLGCVVLIGLAFYLAYNLAREMQYYETQRDAFYVYQTRVLVY